MMSELKQSVAGSVSSQAFEGEKKRGMDHCQQKRKKERKARAIQRNKEQAQ